MSGEVFLGLLFTWAVCVPPALVLRRRKGGGGMWALGLALPAYAGAFATGLSVAGLSLLVALLAGSLAALGVLPVLVALSRRERRLPGRRALNQQAEAGAGFSNR